jgi:hypothetical protein
VGAATDLVMGLDRVAFARKKLCFEPDLWPGYRAGPAIVSS